LELPEPLEPLNVQAPASFRRLMLAFAVVLISLELGAFWYAARLTALLSPHAGSTAELWAFIAFWSLLTAQAMVVAGFAWVLVAVAYTTLSVTDAEVRLAHPWRRWSGAWGDVAEAYAVRDWLHVRPRRHWRTWHLKLRDDSPELMTTLERIAPADVWLTREQARTLMLRRVVPPLFIGGAVGAGAILMLNRWITTVLTSPH
jgi:hypothetical protein